eukprot:jgi/Chlat1/8724/Chrsp9S08556
MLRSGACRLALAARAAAGAATGARRSCYAASLSTRVWSPSPPQHQQRHGFSLFASPVCQLSQVQEDLRAEQEPVKDILNKLSNTRRQAFVFSVDSKLNCLDAVKSMVDNEVGSAIVMQGEKVMGIVTERDYLRKIVTKGLSGLNTPVTDIMTPYEKMVVVDSTYGVEDCMAIMTEKQFRHLPVVDNGKLTGVLSIRDLVANVAAAREAKIQYLQDFINSTGY